MILKNINFTQWWSIMAGGKIDDRHVKQSMKIYGGANYGIADYYKDNSYDCLNHLSIKTYSIWHRFTNFGASVSIVWPCQYICICIRNWTCYPEQNSRLNCVYASDHSFGTYAKFSEKLIFLTPWYAQACVHVSG